MKLSFVHLSQIALCLFASLIIEIFRMKAIRDRRTMKLAGVSASNPGSNTMPHFPYNFLYNIRSGWYSFH